jgi:hypothetical protein
MPSLEQWQFIRTIRRRHQMSAWTKYRRARRMSWRSWTAAPKSRRGRCRSSPDGRVELGRDAEQSIKFAALPRHRAERCLPTRWRVVRWSHWGRVFHGGRRIPGACPGSPSLGEVHAPGRPRQWLYLSSRRSARGCAVSERNPQCPEHTTLADSIDGFRCQPRFQRRHPGGRPPARQSSYGPGRDERPPDCGAVLNSRLLWEICS